MRVITRVFASGERYPMLVDADGMPVTYPTLYATTQLRNSAKSANTIEANLQSIKLLYEWCYANQINLEETLSSAKLFDTTDIEGLCYYLRVKKNNSIAKSSSKVILFKDERIKTEKTKIKAVAKETLYIRITYIADYIEWLVKLILTERKRLVDRETHKKIARMAKELKARRPTRSITSRGIVKGLSNTQRKILEEVTNEDHELNPFPERTRRRDSLLVELFLKTGVRLGELLSIQIKDINFQQNILLIPRRHDNPKDPRAKQPVAKTLSRKLVLSKELAVRIHNYIISDRSRVSRSNKHDFLFVAYKDGPFCGSPLTAGSVYRIFNIIRNNKNELSNLTPHMLRHTWNDIFSEKADSLELEEAKEEKMRSYIMGWKEGSGTSAIYTKRHIEKKAHEVSLLLQGGNSNDKL